MRIFLVNNFTTVFVMLLACCYGAPIDPPGQMMIRKLMPMTPARDINIDRYLEVNGKLKKTIHKEIFLGDHDDADHINLEKAIDMIRMIFIKADTDQDSSLSKAEVQVWLTDQTEEHLETAKKRNQELFAYLDTDKDNVIYWDEYMQTFNHTHHTDDNEDGTKVKSELAAIKQRWSNTDSNGDFGLNLEEFLMFRHPETNDKSITRMADTLMGFMDKNRDGLLSKDEFLVMKNRENTGADDYENAKIKKDIENSEKDFENADSDRDKFISFSELLGSIFGWVIVSGVEGQSDAVSSVPDPSRSLKKMRKKMSSSLPS